VPKGGELAAARARRHSRGAARRRGAAVTRA
jgi:hypothetical protein